MIFDCAQLVSFLPQGTTLPAGTVILTGAPAGVGLRKKPLAYLHGFVVELLPHIVGACTWVLRLKTSGLQPTAIMQIRNADAARKGRKNDITILLGSRPKLCK
ncbi:hypothetical protein F5Y05DRAFT_144076 [Hypoxylon sp. FL0543]|nr:hypothetical protein F5Y05DRAFT_144076 [Hypoxylon sp. FL0543]